MIVVRVKGDYARAIGSIVAIGCIIIGDSVFQGKILVIDQTKRWKLFIWINDGTQNEQKYAKA